MKIVRNTLFLGSALALAACGGELNSPESLEAAELGQTEAPLLKAEPGKAVPGQYIVVFKDGVDAQSMVALLGVKPLHTYSIIPGFAAQLTLAELQALRKNPNVAYVEDDGVVSIDATQTGATWGIDRIDQRTLPLNGTYNYTTTASNVHAYIIDTGIYATHPEFGGRAANVYDALGGNGTDCNGHGTHVAGTVGSATYGVAKGVRLRGVRVLNCSGSGTWSQVIAGMDWVRVNHVKPAVANMSLGGSTNTSVNKAATNLANAGVYIAVAAGNSNTDACSFSPAGAANVTTVAASVNNDSRATYSNYGSCIDIYAPGTNITSTWLNGGTNTISGTSMASPHVAGLGALYKATFGDGSQATVESCLNTNATANVITGNPAGTVNRLVYKGTL